jgi:hypothetical protein
MATMELTESEVALIARARQTPEERAADNAARREAQEAAMLNRMGLAERDAYNAKKAVYEKFSPVERMAAQFLTMKATADEHLARPEVAAVVDNVQVVIDGLNVKPILQAKPAQTPPAKKK